MPTPANPTRPVLDRLRRVLAGCLDLPPDEVQPRCRLEDLVPYDRRRAVWRALRKEGLWLPSLGFSRQVSLWNGLLRAVLFFGTLGLWLQAVLPKFLLAPVVFASWLVTRKYAVHITHGPVTVHDAALYFTSYKEHKPPDYYWSPEDISTKVRLILSAEILFVPLEKVTPEARLMADLGME